MFSCLHFVVVATVVYARMRTMSFRRLQSRNALPLPFPSLVGKKKVSVLQMQAVWTLVSLAGAFGKEI